MKSLKENIYIKVISLIIIGLLLLIPAAMIKNLVFERESIRSGAILEVSSKWGKEQTIAGPFISVPYDHFVKVKQAGSLEENLVKTTEYLHILPEELNINGIILPEKRYRGIYEIVLYNSSLEITGYFTNFNSEDFDIPIKDIHFDKAKFIVGLSDLKGIEKQIILQWNDENILFNPGVINTDVVNSGISADAAINNKEEIQHNFSFNLLLRGSQYLHFTPVGKVTNVNISSTWDNPSFAGEFLPVNRTVADTGFAANWHILNLNRNYPQFWTGKYFSVSETGFGIELLLPVDHYHKSYRTVQYAILFVGFTFLAFFFIEVLKKVYVHPVQYILVGIALIVFYTLLLSISEYINYNYAFLLSAAATLLLIAAYSKAILKSKGFAVLISGILFILYSFIFVIIQLQDYALLIGSIGVFIVLALVMFLSRKIDWYNINIEVKTD